MIDWNRVAELRNEVGDDGFHEIVSLFLEETDEVIARLRGGDISALGRDLHFLKGSALNLGLRAMAQLCQEGERLWRAGEPRSVNLRELAAIYDDSKSTLERGLLRDSAA